MQHLIIALSVLAIAAGPAYAQAVDVRPVVSQIIEWAGLALMAGGGFLIKYLLDWLQAKIKLNDSEFEALLSDRLNDILHRAIEQAIVVAQNEVNKPGSGLKAVKFDNFFLNIAVNYAVEAMPDIIEYFGLTRERIEKMVTARLSSYLDQVPAEGGAAVAQKAADQAQEAVAQTVAAA